MITFTALKMPTDDRSATLTPMKVEPASSMLPLDRPSELPGGPPLPPSPSPSWSSNIPLASSFMVDTAWSSSLWNMASRSLYHC